ncbi:tetratricopeptide repeat protein [Streptomyces bauhiniae]|uniref:Tetratricopeptide repeat protein n=1 Tax=Streptomyces bauhiniae TaxID=2340725 RepID=A0A7K3QYR2_9ACTN|nr:tetratricopeptide repeat protein [Streptomyces bauhiniae]NEB94965.1 tetratricopeptide repeat protein [Streptomyces bauhiniae]
MSRLSFEKRRGDRPVQVRVSATGTASVAGTPVLRAPDEDIHDAVLNHLHHLATSHGTPIRATIHDDAAGCLVPLEISPDGTTRMTGEPTRLPAAPGTVQPPRGVFGPPPVMGGAEGEPIPERRPRAASGTVNFRKPKPGPGYKSAPAPGPGLALGAMPAAGPGPELALGPKPSSGPGPEHVLGAKAASGPGPEHVLGAKPASGPGPEHVLGAKPASGPGPEHVLGAKPAPGPGPELVLGAKPAPGPAPELVLGLKPAPEAEPEPIPPSRFDAIAEEMLAEAPVGETSDGDEVWTAALARVGDAVRDGEVERAAELASRAVAKASRALGPRHPEVLHLRELCAYIAYLTGDPARAFDLSLDLARKRAESGDPAAAYSNVRSAATAWRAVGDAEQALRMGRELIDVWTALAAKPGPAASDPRPLESAHTRMTRLTARAAAAEA